MIEMKGGLYPAFDLTLSVVQGVDEVGLEGKAMRLADSLILLYIRAAEGCSILVEILHRIVPVAWSVIGFQGGAGVNFSFSFLKACE